ncbi:hypothetical protein EHM76_00280 [bacterium]|nr:MAG: hypothetical protein EHM76_00280 [bacterium]
MTAGPGRYDHVATRAREMTDAKAVVVIVIGGNLGEGFSVQTDNPTILLSLSDLLEDVAAQLRRDFRDSEL